jgi:hypothetical protein
MKSVYCWVCIIALLAFGIGVTVGRHHPPGFGVGFVQMFHHDPHGAMDWMRQQFRPTGVTFSPVQTTTGNSNTNIGVINGQVTIN